MEEFLRSNPEYIIILFICIYTVYKVVQLALKGDNNEDNEDDDGGMLLEDPILDLPPGVTLPSDSPTEVLQD